MADKYCDLDLATGLNDGSSWANAYQTLTAGFSGPAAGDTLWVQGDQAAGSPGSNPTFSNNGTVTNPLVVIGVKNGTTNAPPAETDIVDDYNDVNMPTYTQTNWGMNFSGYVYVWGIKFDVNDWINFKGEDETNKGLILEQCWLRINGAQGRYMTIGSNATTQYMKLINTKFQTGSASDRIEIYRGGIFEWHGGELAGSALGALFGGAESHGVAEVRGVDLSIMGANKILVDASAMETLRVICEGCKTGSGFTIGTSTSFTSWGQRQKLIRSNDSTGITSSVQDVSFADRQGTISEETTVVRTNGADDGDSGGWAWAMTLNTTSVLEQFLSLQSPPITGWITGDGTTSQTVTIYICNSDTESAGNRLQNDEVWVDLFYPSGTGDTQQEFVTGRITPKTTVADHTVDSGSTWGTGGNNAQKIVINLDGSPNPIPDYNGPITAIVHFAKRTSPPTLYVDPILDIA